MSDKQLTRTELLSQVRAAKPKTKEQRNKIVCALIGHSLIVEGCFGYEKLDWRHKLYTPDPFKKAKAA